ncbi:MAG: BREX protein BrxB domain-containing protein [Coriobacteriia bacterium]|nr:BREX protein BrxB domain-containing protein [Coriobacteriia bacterium]
MSEWKERLTRHLEPVLSQPDPRPAISAYHDMPYAIFHYPPEDEWAVRRETSLLKTRLEQVGKRVTMISLSECMWEALEVEDLGARALGEAERAAGLEAAIDTVHHVLSECRPLDQLVAARIPGDADPLRDVVLIVRAGALFPVYRTSSLLEQLKGTVSVPAVLFYPGILDGAAGLKFMGVLDAEHNYRPKIF